MLIAGTSCPHCKYALRAVNYRLQLRSLSHLWRCTNPDCPHPEKRYHCEYLVEEHGWMNASYWHSPISKGFKFWDKQTAYQAWQYANAIANARYANGNRTAQCTWRVREFEGYRLNVYMRDFTLDHDLMDEFNDTFMGLLKDIQALELTPDALAELLATGSVMLHDENSIFHYGKEHTLCCARISIAESMERFS